MDFYSETMCFRVDEDMIEVSLPLLKSEQTPQNSWLAVGSLVHTYCKTQYDCENKPAVRRFIQTVQDKLQNGCSNIENTEKVYSIYCRKIKLVKKLSHLFL